MLRDVSDLATLTSDDDGYVFFEEDFQINEERTVETAEAIKGIARTVKVILPALMFYKLYPWENLRLDSLLFHYNVTSKYIVLYSVVRVRLLSSNRSSMTGKEGEKECPMKIS